MKSKYCVLILVMLSGSVWDRFTFAVWRNTCPWLNFSSTNNRNYSLGEINVNVTVMNLVQAGSTEGSAWVMKSFYDPSSHTAHFNQSSTWSKNGSEKLFAGSSRLEIPLGIIRNSTDLDNAHFAFITYNGFSKRGLVNNIKHSSGKVKFWLPLVTNLATVISNSAPTCQSSLSFNIMFHSNQELMLEDVICVRLSVENCSKVWTSDGCNVYYRNDTHVGCTFTELSTFTVLKRIQSIENAVKVLSSFPAKLPTSDGGNKAEEYAKITQHLASLEEVSQKMAVAAVAQGELKISSDIQEITVQALPINGSLSGKANLSTATTLATISWDTVRGNQTSGVACVATIVLKGSESGMDADHLENKYKMKPKLVSDVLTVSISATKKGKLSSPISLQFTQSENRNPDYFPICAYWASTPNRSGWLSDGCIVQSSEGNQTVCSCTHLTSFAVLMAPREIPDSNETILQKITYIGITLSLVCLLLSLIAFSLCRSMNNVRITLHTHLSLSLFLAEVLFVIDIDKTSSKAGCTSIAILLHYLFLACFTWMLLEGVQLYLMVVKVFHSRSLQQKYLYIIGYGFPVVIVAITAAIDLNAYGTEKYCWLTLTSGFIWAFLGPVCAIVGVNAIFFIITMWKLVDKFSMLSTDVPYFKKVRSFIFTAIAQLILLGGTWIFGIFHITGDSIFMSYIFTTINSLQGVFIFILHCLLNKQVRSEVLNTFSKITKDSRIRKSSNPFSTMQGVHRSEASTITYS